MQEAALTEAIIGCAMKVHSALGPGYAESVHESALAHEMRKAGLAVECQRPLRVMHDGVVVGDFVADMAAEGPPCEPPTSSPAHSPSTPGCTEEGRGYREAVEEGLRSA